MGKSSGIVQGPQVLVPDHGPVSAEFLGSRVRQGTRIQGYHSPCVERWSTWNKVLQVSKVKLQRRTTMSSIAEDVFDPWNCSPQSPE
ncbi:hypothetical protein M8818_005512 [Zalaria obscura]|uniref:Uncharacterized protein n=1 Tax=Zalaria obscura TaxID=2024903 RepID=A0ACC3S8V0_9PEZI